MVSNRCKIVVKEVLREMGLHFIIVDLGEVEIMETLSTEQKEELKASLLESGLELMDDRKAVLIEKINKFFIVGIGINVVKSPTDTLFPAAHLREFGLNLTAAQIFDSFKINYAIN